MPGSGKSATGKILASSLKFKFLDLDEEIVHVAGKSIPKIFEEDGEDHFRYLESLVLGRSRLKSNQVIATGGGIVVRPENWSAMESRGRTIYLKTSPEWVYERTKNSKERPLLNCADPQAAIAALYAKRSALYEKADFTIVTDNKTPAQVAGEIKKVLGL